jgi:hypothetical protein
MSLTSQLGPQGLKSIVFNQILVIPELDCQVYNLLCSHQVSVEAILDHFDVTDLAITLTPFLKVILVWHEVHNGAIGRCEHQLKLTTSDLVPANLTVEHSLSLSLDTQILHPIQDHV